MRSLTGEQSQRAAALKMGVSQSVLSRWLNGAGAMPIGTLVPLVVRFGCDPVEALIVWGFLKEEDVDRLNWKAVAEWMPRDVLTGEVHRRTVEDLQELGADPFQKTGAAMLRKA